MLCNLTDAGLLRFTGDDAQTFLHNQLTCDVGALAPGRSTYGAYCTPKGRILASFLLWRTEDGFFMQLPGSLREPIQKQLSKFILRSKVKIADATGDWMLLGVTEGDAQSLAQHAAARAPARVHEVGRTADAMMIRLPGERYEILGAPDKAPPPELYHSLSDAQKVGPEHWEWADIRAGIPVITPATQEEFVPQMVNLDLIGGVSFEKGCYPGQEIVARMHFRGTLKQRMVLAHIESAEKPQPGEKLYSPDFGEQACGTIVNAASAPGGGHDVLASIQISAAEKGGVRWNDSNGPVLELLPLPYLPAPRP
jgi:folate-binding protein YgfZ